MPRIVICFAGCLFLVSLASGCGMMAGGINNNRGIGYFDQGEYSHAAEEFRRAVADNPYNTDYLSNYATAMKKSGRLEKAEQSYLQALENDPSHQPSYHGLASMYLETGQTDLAQNLMKSWVDTQPYDPAAHIEMAWLHRETGNEAAAEQELRAALQISPNHPVAMAQLGQVYQETGRPREALTMYQSSLVNNWYQPEVQHRVAAMNPAPAMSPNGTQMAYGPPNQYANGPRLTDPSFAVAPQPTYAPAPDPAFSADPAHVPATANAIPEIPAY